jgi:hypothetical protein
LISIAHGRHGAVARGQIAAETLRRLKGRHLSLTSMIFKANQTSEKIKTEWVRFSFTPVFVHG